MYSVSRLLPNDFPLSPFTPPKGVVVTWRECDALLIAFSLADGSEVARSTVPLPRVHFIVANPVGGTVFASAGAIGAIRVLVFVWRDGSPAATATGDSQALPFLEPAGSGWLEDAEVTQFCRPLAYVPPSRVCPSAHLVVGHHGSPVVAVFALPSLCLVCRVSPLIDTHALLPPTDDQLTVGGLAGDPSGNTLVVFNTPVSPESNCAHIIEWPLREMGLWGRVDDPRSAGSG